MKGCHERLDGSRANLDQGLRGCLPRRWVVGMKGCHEWLDGSGIANLAQGLRGCTAL